MTGTNPPSGAGPPASVRRTGHTGIGLVQRWPFLALAAFTLVVGVAWHLAGVGRDSGPMGAAFYWFAYILGAPFIGAMTLATRTIAVAPLRPLLGLVLGLAPYVVADLLVRRWRRTRAS